MYYLKIANYIDLLTIYSNQIHDLIIVFKSKPDSVIKNSCNYVNARNIVTTDPKNYYNYNNSKISNKLTKLLSITE